MRAKTNSGPDRQYSRSSNWFFRCLSVAPVPLFLKVDVPVLPSPQLQRESVNIFMTNLHGCLQLGKVEQLFDTSVPRIA